MKQYRVKIKTVDGGVVVSDPFSLNNHSPEEMEEMFSKVLAPDAEGANLHCIVDGEKRHYNPSNIIWISLVEVDKPDRK